MSEDESTANSPSGELSDLNAVFRCLASNLRRHLLGILYTRSPGSLTRRDLALYLVSGDHMKSGHHSDELSLLDSTLQHTHLPRLETAGLIKLDAAHRTVSITNHAAFEDSGIIRAITGEHEGDSDSLDDLFSVLSDPYCREILDVLSHQFGPIHTETLARELGSTERDNFGADVSEKAIEERLGCLYHIYIPRLSEADMIEYDADAETVAYVGHSALRASWMHSELEPRFRASLTGESAPEGIGEIHGRENVVSFGQSLCDRADEELFCMFTDTGLLEAGCFARIRNAADRGIDVYLGTRDQTVREYIQENAPNVILWKPNTSWLNFPAAGGRVGRLLLADREAVMLGTIRDDTIPERPSEHAIIGEEVDNTLVTMISQLLAPHLDKINGESDDIESRLPL